MPPSPPCSGHIAVTTFDDRREAIGPSQLPPLGLLSAHSVYTLWRLGLFAHRGTRRGELVDHDPPLCRDAAATSSNTFDVSVFDQVTLGPVDGGHAVFAQAASLEARRP